MILQAAAWFFAVALPVPDDTLPTAWLERGAVRVAINGRGVVTQVPAAGLVPEFGPRVPIKPGFHEWLGLSFDTPAGRMSGVLAGDAADWAGRTEAEPVRFEASADRVTAVTRLGPFEIVAEYWFSGSTTELVAALTLKNVSSHPATMVFVTREWRLQGVAGEVFPPEFAGAVPPAPPDIHRVVWMPNNVLPGRSQAVAFGYVEDAGAGFDDGVDLPLREWTGPNWPDGINFGASAGVTVGDFDHDGWFDVFACTSGNLWRSIAGTDWQFVTNLEGIIGNSRMRYSAAMADYDDDQLPDLGTEPRKSGDDCMHLLRNLGGGAFDEVADDPAVVDVQPCESDSETMCVADVDGDTDLDWFLPTYPDWLDGPGNWFLENLGPVGPGGAYAFREASRSAGLDNPGDVNRPEGAEFVDVDGDGDVDLYSNGTLYRNKSRTGAPKFKALTENATGIIYSDVLDEGAVFFDYDMDGDLDLMVSFTDASIGLRMFESQGDATYFVTKKSTFDSNDIGLNFGVSCEDWDNDGDVDATSKQVFRRNMWMEEGQRHFIVATHSLDPGLVSSATPGWFDWDRDGDLDAAVGNYSACSFLENYLYDATTPEDGRRYVRVRVVRDSDVFDDGMESEFGAQVAVDLLGAADDGMERVKVVTTAGGYLNQPEYVLHFGLPADPAPDDPEVDLHFSVTVDLKGAAEQGFARVDRHTNPALGDIHLADLEQREIVVYRSGRVKLGDCDFRPSTPAVALTTTTGGLVAPGIDAPPPPLVPSPGSDWFVGIEVSTALASGPQRIEELILDGHLDAEVVCDGAANVLVWDVTDPGLPLLVSGGAVVRNTKARNHRSFLPLDVTLAPARLFRIVTRVKELRATPITGPVTDGAMTTNGGLSFADASPCTGAGVAAALVDPASVYLAVRFRSEPSAAWADLGHGLGGAGGVPKLVATGDLRGGTPYTLDLTQARANAPLFVIAGSTAGCLHFAGGTIVPALELVIGGLATDPIGTWSTSGIWPDGIGGGATFHVQALIVDDTAPQGFAFSNAVVGTTPY